MEKILIVPFHSLIYEYESKSRIYGKDVLISNDKGGIIAYKCSAGYAGIRTGGVHFKPNSRAHYSKYIRLIILCYNCIYRIYTKTYLPFQHS